VAYILRSIVEFILKFIGNKKDFMKEIMRYEVTQKNGYKMNMKNRFLNELLYIGNLKKSIREYKEQIEKFREIFMNVLDYTNELENKLNISKGIKKSVIDQKQDQSGFDLEKKLGKEMVKNRILEKNIKLLSNDLEEYMKIHTLTIEHASNLENELDDKIKVVTRLSITDPLTGITNRLKFNANLENEISRKKRSGENFSIIMFDIDFFKKVNDTYGHEVGDYILVTICNIIKKQVRNIDTFSRWGGEEFLILSVGSNLETAVRIAERMCYLIGEHEYGKVGKVTCSFGVTEFRPDDSINSLLSRVDKNTYTAKNSGRNRVIGE